MSLKLSVLCCGSKAFHGQSSGFRVALHTHSVNGNVTFRKVFSLFQTVRSNNTPHILTFLLACCRTVLDVCLSHKSIKLSKIDGENCPTCLPGKIQLVKVTGDKRLPPHFCEGWDSMQYNISRMVSRCLLMSGFIIVSITCLYSSETAHNTFEDYR